MTVNHWVPGSSPGRGAKYQWVWLDLGEEQFLKKIKGPTYLANFKGRRVSLTLCYVVDSEAFLSSLKGKKDRNQLTPLT